MAQVSARGHDLVRLAKATAAAAALAFCINTHTHTHTKTTPPLPPKKHKKQGRRRAVGAARGRRRGDARARARQPRRRQAPGQPARRHAQRVRVRPRAHPRRLCARQLRDRDWRLDRLVGEREGGSVWGECVFLEELGELGERESAMPGEAACDESISGRRRLYALFRASPTAPMRAAPVCVCNAIFFRLTHLA